MTSSASASAPALDWSYVVKARKITKPAKIAKPPARTPKTPDARSPSVKKLPSGARRRTKSIAVIELATATTTMTPAQSRLTGDHPGGLAWLVHCDECGCGRL